MSQVSVSKRGLQISRHSASEGRGREPTIRSLFTVFPLSYFKNCAAFKSLLIERWIRNKSTQVFPPSISVKRNSGKSLFPVCLSGGG